MIVHWAGKGSDYIIALAKDIRPSNHSTSTVYISNDYGMSFTPQQAIKQINTSTNALIDHFYNSPASNGYYIFTDIIHNYTFTTTNYGRNFQLHPVPFKPKLISFHPSNRNVVLGMDEDEPLKKLYVTTNLGFSWRMISYNVKSFTWGVEPFDYTGSIYIERTSAFGTSTVLRSTDYFRTSTAIISNVLDFEVRSSYMFATKRNMFHSNDLQLYVSYNREPFQLARFPHNLAQLDFYIPDASENQVFACVNHNKSLTNLYISDVQGSNFSLSLERIVYFNPDGANNDTWLNYYSDESFADIHKVEGLRGVYIASQLRADTLNIENQTSWVTFDKGGEWQHINAPSVDSQGESTNCSAWRTDCSLHLTQLLSHFYPGSRSVPILSTESAPGMIIASGTIGKSMKREVDVFLSRNGGMTWQEIMKGQNFYAVGDHGGLLLAVPQSGYIDTLYYSYDEGEQWLPHKFSDAKIRVYGVLTEPGEKTAIFSLFGSYTGRHSWLIVQVNLTGIFPYNCNSNDYKEWSMSDELPGRSCLLGTKIVYERRNSHSKCYNGVEYERGQTVSNCSCTRLDYECDFGFELDSSHYNCVDDPESTVDVHAIPSPCPEGTYYPYTRGYRKVSGDYCSGGDARRYDPLMQSCPIQDLPEFLLYAMRTSIHRYILGDNRDEVLVDEGILNAIAVDYDYNNECLYWADIQKKNIQRLCPDQENNHTLEIIIGDGVDGVDTVEGIAYDWTSKNLYWIDSAARKIEVSNRDGIFRRVLFNSSYVDKPRAIALDPDQGWMYWTDWSATNPRVCRAWMDGNPSSLQVLANGSSVVYWPNGITVDYQAQKIYWTDAHLKRIMVANTDGSQRRILIQGTTDLPDPYAIGVYKDQLFWTDWLKYAIMTASKIDGHGVEAVRSNLHYILDLKVLHKASQTNHGRCYTNGGGCSQLCLPKPTLLGSTNINRTCLCADNVTHIIQTGGGEICTCPPGERLVGGFCTRGEGSNCTASQFACSNNRCIPLTWQCDHDNDCHDGSDELDCQYDPCHDNYFTCTNSRCIPYRWKCDHDNDCVDNSDEEGCTYPTCDGQEFTCDNGRCINETWVCDMDNDCHDSSDERNCSTSAPVSCSPSQFSCTNRRPPCIPMSWRCDSGRDCSDGSDEAGCSGRTCDSQHFQCTNSSTCIHKNWRCDGENDCSDRSDELNCPSMTTRTTHPSWPTTIPSSCQEFQFRCHNGLCIPWTERCDFVNDCGDNSDELMCSHSTSLPNMTCSSAQFTCNNGDCISLWRRCNGVHDCRDDSDENYHMCQYSSTTTAPTVCRASQFQCYLGGDLHCIYMSWVCDGENDCLHGEDERNCTGPTTCPPDNFRCLFSEGCIPDRYVCNGYPDCSDRTDEYGCNSTGPPTTARPGDHCQDMEYRCSTGSCLSYFTWCDGSDDCPGGEDERHCPDYASVKTVYIQSTTNHSIIVNWVPAVLTHGVQGDVSYIISSMEINNYRTWINNTWSRSNSYTIAKLRPFTQYIVAVYPKVGTTAYKRSPSLLAATEEGVPGPPTTINAANAPDKTTGEAILDISWKQPKEINGRLTHFEVFFIDLSTLISRMVTIISLGKDDTVYHQILTIDQLTEGTTYNVYVVAYTRVGGGPPSDTKTIQYDKKGLQWDITNLKSKVTSNTVTLTWNAVTEPGVKYEVSYEDAWEREFHKIVVNNNCTVQRLTPMFEYQFQVQVVKGSTRGKVFPIVTTTAGPRLDPPHDVNFTDIGMHSVSVSWLHDKIESGLTYTVLYSEKSGNKPMNKSTSDLSVTIDDLLACETYEFQLAVTGDSLSLKSSAVSYVTDYYPNAPAKDVECSVFNLTCVNITWAAPCTERDIELGYYVYLTDPTTGNRSSGAKPYTKTSDLYMYYSVCKLTRGATYEASVQTTTAGAIESAPTAFTVSKWNRPVAVEITQEDSVLQWLPPVELSQAYDLAYDVSCRRNDTPNIWQFTSTVRQTRFTLTSLDQDVDYVCRVRVSKRNGYPGDFSRPVFVEKPPAVASSLIYSNTSLIEIVVPICVVVVALVAILGMLFIRHRRLQRTFLSFANSHYDPRSGRTTFSSADDLGEDEDSPMITGFSDDEPLVLA